MENAHIHSIKCVFAMFIIAQKLFGLGNHKIGRLIGIIINRGENEDDRQ